MDNLFLTILAFLTLLFAPTMAQNDSPLSTPTDGMPTPSDSAHDGDQGPSNTVSLVNYYFVFLALIVCFAGLAAFFMYKRKKKYGTIMRQSREGALPRDLNTWDPIRARRRYWQGRWRSAEHSREEGLNEFGEAPPPYVPKSREEEGGQQNGNGANELPAVPMQALSREQAGLKPPDYAETQAQPVSEDTTTSSTTASTTPQEYQRPEATQQPHTTDVPAPPQAPRYG